MKKNIYKIRNKAWKQKFKINKTKFMNLQLKTII